MNWPGSHDRHLASASDARCIAFRHGLGDSANFAPMISMLARRGLNPKIACNDDKAIIFRAAGATIVPEGIEHSWNCAPETPSASTPIWASNKIGWNLTRWPMKDLGQPEELWRELLATTVTLAPVVSHDTSSLINDFLSGMARPIILFHAMGNSFAAAKNLSVETIVSATLSILDRCCGTVILLDWDNRAPVVRHPRCRHVQHDFRLLSVPELWCLLDESDLVISIDSGPFHLARMTSTPTIGVWTLHHPATYALPRLNTLNLVPSAYHDWSHSTRGPYNIIDIDEPSRYPTMIVDIVERFFSGAWLFHEADVAARDVQLQYVLQHQLDDNRFRPTSGTATPAGSISRCLAESARRFPQPTILAISSDCLGCRAYAVDHVLFVFAAYLDGRKAGHLITIAADEATTRRIRAASGPFENVEAITQAAPATFLGRFPSTIDILYVALDTDASSSSSDLCEDIIAAALPKMTRDSLIMIEESDAGSHRKGTCASSVGNLLRRDWKILAMDHRALLGRHG